MNKTSAFECDVAIPGRTVLNLLIMACTFLVLAQLGHLLSFQNNVAAIWFPAGLAMAAYANFPMKKWGWLLAAFTAANLVSDILFQGKPLSLSLGFCVANAIEAMLGAAFARIIFGLEMDSSFRKLLNFLVCQAIAAPLVGGLIGALILRNTFGAEILHGWISWSLADSLGVISVFPIFFLLLKGKPQLVSIPKKKLLEFILYTIAQVGTISFVYSYQHYPVQYLTLAFLVISAIRLPRFWLQIITFESVIATAYFTSHGGGILSPYSVLEQELLLQLWLLINFLIPTTISFSIEASKTEKNAKEKFAFLAESSPDFIGICDMNFIPIYANPSALELLGIENQEEALKTPVKDFFFPEDQPFILNEFFPKVIKEGNGEVEIRFRHFKTGKAIWMLYKVMFIKNQNGDSIGLATVSVNISQRKTLEEKLKVLHSRAELAMRSAQIGTWEWRLSDNALIWDEQMYSLYGITKNQFSGAYESWEKGVHPEDLKQSIEDLQTAIKTQKRFDSRFRVVWPTGEVRWIRAFADLKKDSNGNPSSMVGVNWDITNEILSAQHQKEAANKIEEKDIRFRASYENNASGQLNIAKDGIIISANAMAAQIFGYPRAKLIGMNVDELVPAEIKPKHAELRASYLDNPVNRQIGSRGVLMGKHSNGSLVPVEISIAPLNLPGGFEILAMVVDASLRVEQEAKIENTLQELKRSNTELENFAYIASHDLQSPLRHVASFTELLTTKLADSIDPEIQDWTGHIQKGITRMELLIHDLLSYSRVRKEGFKKTEIDLNLTLQTLLDVGVVQEGVKIELEELPIVFGYKTQLDQVFQNLIQNAAKFARKGVPTIIKIRAKENPNYWILSVEDNGIGIEKEFHEKIFGLFQRLHKKEEYAGTGIGLAICKKVVELHGGKIWVESTPGKGTVFYFSLKKQSNSEISDFYTGGPKKSRSIVSH